MAETRHSIEPLSRDKKLFCFGYGYTASFLAERLRDFGWKISGTTTDPEKKVFMKQAGIEAMLYDQNHQINDPFQTFHDVTHVLLSVPPGTDGDPVAEHHGMDLAQLPNLEWVGYLSTTGVYGNHDGAWIDETSNLAPTSRRGSIRVRAEQQWQSLQVNEGLPLEIFRLSGIYGPGRNQFVNLENGTARRLIKQGQVFNRIRVEDIGRFTQYLISLNHGGIYNVTDAEPAPAQDVVEYAARLMGMPVPPDVLFESAELSPMARSFYGESKRVSNAKATALGFEFLYPDYRQSLTQMWNENAWRSF